MSAATLLSDLWSASKPPAIERLARIEGQSNFLSMLQGIEVGPDTTEDMGALSFARMRGCIPETLEAQVAQSTLFKLPLMSIVYRAVISEFDPPEKDLRWIRGAIADAFLLLSRGYCKPAAQRAKRFKVDRHAYAAMRKTAHGVLLEMADRAERAWKAARQSTREIPGNCHTRSSGGYFSPQPQMTTTQSGWTKDSSQREAFTGYSTDPETLYPGIGPDSLWHPERG
jgi:hypothetical protein